MLENILAKKRERLAALKRIMPLAELKRRAEDLPATRDFGGALIRSHDVSVIAELKKASPSKGIIRRDFPVLELARLLERAGASALSVLTEEDYFLGKPEYLSEIRGEVGLPLLRKDFIFEEYQVYESRVLGADAILLIAAVLDLPALKGLMELAHGLGLACLVEVHDRLELERALEAGAGIIGINNRDLRSFRTDISTTVELSRLVPKGSLLVSESGIHSRQEVLLLAQCGVRAVLVGEYLMRLEDVAAGVRELLGLLGDSSLKNVR